VVDLKPRLQAGSYVFCTVQERDIAALDPAPLGLFREQEGITVIVLQETADGLNLSYDSVWSLITLTAHTELTAIGILASVSRKLADAGIPVNAVSACHHDHLFVPQERAQKALEILAGNEET